MSVNEPRDNWSMRDRTKFWVSVQRFFGGQQVRYGSASGSDDQVHVINVWQPEKVKLYVTISNRAKRQRFPVSRTDPRK